MKLLLIVIGVLVGVGIGIAISYSLLKNQLTKAGREALKKAEEDGELIKKEKILQAKEKFLQLKAEHEKACNEKNQQIAAAENRIKQKENTLSQKMEDLNRKNNENAAQKENLNKQMAAVTQKQKELDEQISAQKNKLESIAEMTAEQAKQQLINLMQDEAKADALVMIKEIVDEAKHTANLEAKKVVVNALQRTGTEAAVENTVSVFNIENDEIKGRIIGREGRNIRTLENLTGVDVVIDDSPDTILLSSFDPVRREIARQSLKKLVSDGRIHPARIEEVVAKTKKQIEQEITELGKRTCIDLGINNMHHELMRLVGKMRYRSSYGQNLLQHAKEVANLSATMAAELGINPKLARRAGLLHDIGKGLDYEMEGSHVDIGVDMARKYREPENIVHAIAAHHGGVETTSIIDCLVQAADAVSAARPGARRENVESYIKRLQRLEEIAKEFDGVSESFAIQAGREVRVLVRPEAIKDDEMPFLAREICKKIESELDYPGQIKVNVIRESRASEYAK